MSTIDRSGCKPNAGDSESETEGSHTKDEGEASVEEVYPADKTSVSYAPRRSILWFLGVTLLVVLVALVVPVVVLSKDNNGDSTTASANYDSFEYKPEENQQCPGHLIDGDFLEVSQVYFSSLLLGESGKADDRTFDVEPSHIVLELGGVEFNVETVEEAFQEDLNKAILTKAQIIEQIEMEAAQFYVNMTGVTSRPPLPTINLEVTSGVEDPLVYAGSQGFLAACMMSFAQHLPLVIAPDHLWTVIALGFAHHVNQHAEDLRHMFVDHDGKKEIRIREDSMERGVSPPVKWEELIFPKFSKQIELNMNNDEAYETLAGRFFSTTTATAQAASEIILMSAMKTYFEYTMMTACGIPKIRLGGTRDDWVALRDRAQKLAKWTMPGHSHGELWIQDIVVPILNQFIDAYDGNINYCFWQTMVKFRRTGSGSGEYDFLSGWLPTLFPYLSKEGKIEPNPFLRSWEESASALHKGPEPKDIPGQLSSVPVMWEYYQSELPLHFHAGFRGVTQEVDGTLSPALGWYVTNDPET